MLPRRSALKSIRDLASREVGSGVDRPRSSLTSSKQSTSAMRGFDLDQASANHGTGAGSVEPVFSVSVCLAGRVVPWHTFNLVGFGPVNFQACHSKHQGATVRPGRSASIAAVPTFRARFSNLSGNAPTDPHQRCEMKNPTFAAELHKKLGAPSRETLESLRLLKAFLRLAPRQRFEVIELIERLALDPAAASDRPLF
jgi:hypothetical protein